MTTTTTMLETHLYTLIHIDDTREMIETMRTRARALTHLYVDAFTKKSKIKSWPKGTICSFLGKLMAK